jgi:hypothetical protein
MIELVIEKLSSLVDPLMSFAKDRRELKDNALRAISVALNETCLYQQRIAAGDPYKRELEEQLSRYWAAAAIPIRHVDRELADLCEHKADYWVSPREWDRDKFREIGIALDQMRARYRALLAGKRKGAMKRGSTSSSPAGKPRRR